MLGISSRLNWAQLIPFGLAYVSAVRSQAGCGLRVKEGCTHISGGWLAVGWAIGVHGERQGTTCPSSFSRPWICSHVAGQGSHSSNGSSTVGWWRINTRHWWDKERVLRCRRRSGMVYHPRSFEGWECSVASKAAERSKEGGMGNIRLRLCPEEGPEKQHVYM